jgi:hypothetical protein
MNEFSRGPLEAVSESYDFAFSILKRHSVYVSFGSYGCLEGPGLLGEPN